VRLVAGQCEARGPRPCLRARPQSTVREVAAVSPRRRALHRGLRHRGGHADARLHLGPGLGGPSHHVPRWQPPAPAPRAARRVVRWYERLFRWWRRHTWMAVWMAVALAPMGLFALRLIDDSAVALLVPPALALMIVLFLVVMGAAVRAAAGASLPRALAGAGGALLAVVLLTLPVSHAIVQPSSPRGLATASGFPRS